jgi:hypothetical protein
MVFALIYENRGNSQGRTRTGHAGSNPAGATNCSRRKRRQHDAFFNFGKHRLVSSAVRRERLYKIQLEYNLEVLRCLVALRARPPASRRALPARR